MACKDNHLIYEPLLRNLAEVGHNLSVVTNFPMMDPPKMYREYILNNSEIKYCEEVIDYETSANLSVFDQVYATWKLFKFSVEICRNLVKDRSVTFLHDNIGNFDVVLIENFIGDCSFGLIHNFVGPIVAFSPRIPYPWHFERIWASDNPSYIPNSYQCIRKDLGFLNRLHNTVAGHLWKVFYNIAVQMREQKILNEHYGENFPKLKNVVKNVVLVLSNTHSSFTGVYPKNDNFIEVGGLHIKKSKPNEVSIIIFL